MTSNDMRVSTTLSAAVPIPGRVSAFLTAVYGWMCTGLAITAPALRRDATDHRRRSGDEPAPEGQIGAYAFVGALALYLDFINLFLFLLGFTGGRRMMVPMRAL